MKEVSATEAARGFADLLDAVERDGETFVVVRRGRTVAQIGPAARANGARVKEILRRHPPDPEWWNEILEVRSLLTLEDPWND